MITVQSEHHFKKFKSAKMHFKKTETYTQLSSLGTIYNASVMKLKMK